jgi:hypothetical protein
LEKRDSFLNQKSSQSPFSKRRISPKITGLPRHCVPCNDRGIDSRLRGNDIKGSGNYIKGSGNTKEECPPRLLSFKNPSFLRK